jgi:formylglycine-generating enzyme required for sulfatase activity
VVDFPSLGRPLKKRALGGVAALFSCSEGERAFEHPDLKHGVFFHFIIKGLQGEADFDGDGTIDFDELAAYAKKRVYRYVVNEYRVEQTPELLGKTNLMELASLTRPTVPLPPERPAEPKEITNTLGMKLVRIPAGEFLMGSPDSDKDAEDDEKPQHRVRITRPFYLGATEVTVGQFRRVVEATGLRTEAETDGKGGIGWNEAKGTFEQAPKYTWLNPGFAQTDEHPVVNVSWNDAIAFCNKLSEREGLKPYYQFGGGAQSGGDGYRLPTEAEWEYACRAGSTTRFGFGDDEATLGESAWFYDKSGRKTHPVGRKRLNAFGLYDMHGNVCEWCWDSYDKHYYGQSPGADPLGPSQAAGRVRLGGGWFNNPRSCRSANRGGIAPGYRLGDLGFRVARVQSSR